MMGETAFGIYYWGVYVWFVVGALLIGIPAVAQLAKFFISPKGKGAQAGGQGGGGAK